LHDKKVIDIAGGFYHTIVLVKLKKNLGISKLSSDMKKIINEPSRADVTFVLEGGKVLHAHRCILLARCRFLEERIRANGVKSDERDKQRWNICNPNHLIFELPTFKQKAFHALMEYLYTDTVRSLRETPSSQ
jgi:BTB/POZ domain